MKKNSLLKLSSVILATALLSTGCVGKGADETAQADLNFGDTYPLQTDTVLKWWTINKPHEKYPNWEDQPFYKELQASTGVKLEMQSTPKGQDEQAFNIMIASGDMPDIITYSWLNVSGGPEKYINDGYIVNLDDYDMAKYAPNYTKYLQENPDIDKMVQTDTGAHYSFPFIRGDMKLTTYAGPVVRNDLLKKYKMEVPTTIDEWEAYLTACKNDGFVAPLSIQAADTSSDAFSGAFGVIKDFYLDDSGKVEYGPIKAGWKDFVMRMKEWVDKGLFDKDFGTVDRTMLNNKMASSQSAATVGTGNTMGGWIDAIAKVNPNAEFVGAPYPTLTKGEKPQFGQMDYQFTGKCDGAITKACKNKELAMKFMDYGYSEEGRLLYNYGIEGESYTMVDGVPTFTEKMYEGNVSQNIGEYAIASSAMTIQDWNMYKQTLSYPQQMEAIDRWFDTDMIKHKIPPITPNLEESSDFASVMADVKTYVNEQFFAFIFGKRPIEEFDAYVEEVKSMGIENAIAIKQAGVDRYNAR